MFSQKSSTAVVGVLALVAAAISLGASLLTRHSGSQTTPVAAPVAVAHVSPPSTPQQVLARMTSTALAEGNVHAKSLSYAKGKTITETQDIETASGSQAINGVSGHALIRVIGNDTYFVADRKALIGYFEVSAKVARVAANRWIHLTPGQPDYTAITEGVTLRSVLQEIQLAGPLTRLPVQARDGQRVFGIRGAPADHEAPAGAINTIWITAGPTALPVEYDERGPHHASTTVMFTNWGHTTTPIEPPTAVPQT